ncbi:FAD-binding oxidoreductase [Corynebacterium kroppenstedtii]|uniref:FAD-binding oxidoreductase n=1 Tax=Corynebacterium sp. PCR 32 TaxID=3351342 RepID=UPI0030B2E706
MAHNLWGTPDEAKPLGSSITRIIQKVLTHQKPQPSKTSAEITLTPVALSDDDLHTLATIVGTNHVTTDKEQRLRRARGKSYLDLATYRTDRIVSAPDAVVAPATEDEVLQILQWADKESVAVVTFGGGTSVVGGLTPENGQHRAVLSLDVARFNKLEDVDPISKEATFGAGLSGPHAELMIAKHGLQIGHYPQSFPYASIGGYAATRSSGQSSAGYGRFDEMVRSLTVVTPQGIMNVGHNAPMSAAGPDLRQLFLGSEGTLGIITRVRLRLHTIPEHKEYEAFMFPDFDAAVRGLREVTQQHTGPTVIRLSDEIETAVNLTSSPDKIGEATQQKGCRCLTMYEGTPEHTASRHEETRNLLLKLGAVSLGDEPVRHWEQGRFGAPVLRDALLDAGLICETLETATDWSNVSHLKKTTTAAIGHALAKHGTPSLIMCHVSHVYESGCSLYFTILAGRSENDPLDEWWDVKSAVSTAIVTAGGTITHHHAVGTDHKDYMAGDIGDNSLNLLKTIKNAIDPSGILNPGKLI